MPANPLYDVSEKAHLPLVRRSGLAGLFECRLEFGSDFGYCGIAVVALTCGWRWCVRQPLQRPVMNMFSLLERLSHQGPTAQLTCAGKAVDSVLDSFGLHRFLSIHFLCLRGCRSFATGCMTLWSLLRVLQFGCRKQEGIGCLSIESRSKAGPIVAKHPLSKSNKGPLGHRETS
jgi:hypothetical protein